MRVVGGELRGRTFSPPKTFKARPTTDFAKEGLFNIIANHFSFDEMTVLDLFAGTGSIGIEFASRGALKVDSVELNPIHHRFIREVAQRVGISALAAIRGDAFVYLARCRGSYDVVFADPPYDMEEIAKLPDLVIGHSLLKDGGWFILEHSSKYNFGSHQSFFNHRQYGSVNFSFFRKPV